ncbi:hypothetical protein FXO38_34587 [Capsicum annuum]|nr:hypothetical protein FXO38_34587 [Capsicum annuum]
MKPHPKGIDELISKRTPPPRAAKMPFVKTPIHKPIQTKVTLHGNRKDINRPDSKKSLPVQSPALSSFNSEDKDGVVSMKVFDKFCEKVWQEFNDVCGLVSSRFDQMMNAINENKIFIKFIQNKEGAIEMNVNTPSGHESEVNDMDNSKLDQQYKSAVHIPAGVNVESNVDQHLSDSQNTLPDKLLLSLNANSKEEHYLNGKAKIPVINFGILSVEDKNWFYVMRTPIQMWSDEKSKYDPNISYKFNTVDCNFMNIVTTVFDVYKLDDATLNAGEKKYHLNEYVSGFRMHATVPWHTVDHMFISVHVKAKHHWVIAVISFNHRCIYVYDSLSAASHDAAVLTEIEKLAKVIPICLIECKFYENKGIDIDNHPNYKLNNKMDPFGVSIVENVPQQPSSSLDCGLYMVMYVECLTFGEAVPCIDFDPDLIRIRCSSLLWDYGTRKANAKSQSDDEAPMRPLRITELTEGTEVVDI